MKKYQVGIEFDPQGNTKSTKGLVGGKATNQILKHIKLNKTRNTYIHAWFNERQELVEVWKLNKKEYDQLHCGFGITDFGDFLKQSGLI